MKFESHDDFMALLKPNGYRAMIETVGAYLGK